MWIRSGMAARAIFWGILLALIFNIVSSRHSLEEKTVLVSAENVVDSALTSEVCSDQDTCSGHGRCSGQNGTCVCEPGWGGVACDIFLHTCSENRDCGGGERGNCSTDLATCMCGEGYTGAFCQHCAPGTFGPECKTVCSLATSCGDHGRCSGQNGTCLCEPGWAGEQCEIMVCPTGWWGDQCEHKMSCNSTGECGGPDRGTCVDYACVCQPGYHGERCEACGPDGHGHDCDTVCSLATSCGDHGRCSGQNGTCLCELGWAGDRCEFEDGFSSYADSDSWIDSDGVEGSWSWSWSEDSSSDVWEGPPESGSDGLDSDSSWGESSYGSSTDDWQDSAFDSDPLPCSSGYFGSLEGPCVECEPGSWCVNGSTFACPKNSWSKSGSWTLTNCTCNAGYEGGRLEDMFTSCRLCESGGWCHGGLRFECPANSTAAIGSANAGACGCLAGFSGAADNCTRCPPGTFKHVLGAAACTECPENTFSEASGAAHHSTCQTCPGVSTAPAGSSSAADCKCSPGFSGAECTPAPVSFVLLKQSIDLLEDQGADRGILVPEVVGYFQTRTSNVSLQISVHDQKPPGLLADKIELFTNGSLAVRLGTDISGSALLKVVLVEQGHPGSGIPPARFGPVDVRITVEDVNDPPFFKLNQSLLVTQDASDVSLTVATHISPGPSAEAQQKVSFVVEQVSGPTTLIDGGPTLSAEGILSFKLSDTLTGEIPRSGVLKFSVVAVDDGGVANGGIDSSVPQTLLVTVAERPAMIKSLKLNQVSNSSVLVSFSHPTLSDKVVRIDPILRFMVSFWRKVDTTSTTQQIVNASDCTGGICSSLVQNVLPGEVIVVSVAATNIAGSGPSDSRSIRMLGCPSTPQNVTVRQAPHATSTSDALSVMTQVQVAWALPADSGGGLPPSAEGSAPLVHQLLEAACVPPAEVSNDFEVRRWAVPGSEATSLALVAAWNGSAVSLAPSGGPALLCFLGAELRFRVRASNALEHLVGPGTWSAVAATRVQAPPSVVWGLRTLERARDVLVSWHSPTDTGLGDATAPVSAYLIDSSRCPSFAGPDQDDSCETRHAVVTRAQAEATAMEATSGEPLAAVVEGLAAAQRYFFRVRAVTAVGSGAVSEAPVVHHSFKLPMIVTVPAQQPVWIASAPDYLHVWGAGGWHEQLKVVLAQMPEGITAEDEILAECEVRGLDAAAPKMPTTLPVAVQTSTVESTATAGHPVLRLLLWLPRVNCSLSECPAILSVAPQRFPAKQARIEVVFFQYPLAVARSISPDSGPEQGGAPVVIAVDEPLGERTRAAAGLATLREAAGADARSTAYVVLACRAARSEVPAKVAFSTAATDGRALDLTFWTPPAPCGARVPTTIELWLRPREGPDVRVSLQAGGARLAYMFVGPVLGSVSPAGGMLFPGSGGMRLSLVLENIMADAGTTLHLSVTLAGAPCKLISFSPYIAARQLVVSVVAPELPLALAGRDVNISVVGATAQPLIAPWTLLAPPPVAFVAGSLMLDDAPRAWTPLRTAPATARLSLAHLTAAYGREFDALEVQVGARALPAAGEERGAAASDVTWSFNPAAVGAGRHPLRIVAWHAGALVANVSDAHEGWLEVRDLSTPEVVAVAPTAVAALGGAVVLVGVTAAPTLVAAAAGSVEFELAPASGGEAARGEVLGVVPLADWEGKSGAVYAEAMRRAGQLARASEALAAEYARLPARVAAAAAASPADGARAEAAVLLLRVPTAASAGAHAAAVVTGSGARVVEFELEVAALPVGAAQLVSAATEMGDLRGGLRGGTRVSVRVSNFPIVLAADEVMVSFGDAPAALTRLLRSDTRETVFVVAAPHGYPGAVQVHVRAGALPSANCSFLFQYYDDSAPVVEALSPYQVYADRAGNEVTVTLSNVHEDVSAEQVEAWLETASGSRVKLPVASVQAKPSTVMDPASLVVTILTVAAAPGVASVFLTVRGKSVSAIDLELVAPPAAQPHIAMLAPSLVLCSPGGALLSFAVANLRQVAGMDLRVEVADSVLVSAATHPSSISVASSMALTSVRLILPDIPGYDGQNMSLRVWSVVDPSRVAATTLLCQDARRAELVYAVPAHALAGSEEVFLLAIARLGLAKGAVPALVPMGDGFTLSLDSQNEVDAATTELHVRVKLSRDTTGPVTFAVTSCAEKADCPSKWVLVEIMSLDPDGPRVTDFFPMSETTFGGTEMRVRLAGVVAEVAGAVLEFGSANSSMLRSKAAAAADGVDLFFSIPAAMAPASLAPRLHVPGTSPLDFPASFAYVHPRNPAVAEVAPLSAPVSAPARIRVLVHDLPGAEDPALLAVEFECAGGAHLKGTVVAVVRENPSLHPARVQALRLDVTTPTDVPAGAAALRVWHRAFPTARAALAASGGFSFLDESLPQVSRVQGAGGAGRLPLSLPSELALSLRSAPRGADPQALVVLLAGARLSVVLASGDPAQRTVRVVVSAPPARSVGARTGLVAFSELPAGCDDTCCTDGGCAAACSGVPVACFSATYFDDRLPQLTVRSGGAGPHVGGGRAVLAIANFPALVSASDVAIEVEGAEARTEALLVASTAASTELVLLLPPLDLGIEAERLAAVTITPAARPDRAVAFNYHYRRASPALASLSLVGGRNDVAHTLTATISDMRLGEPLLVLLAGRALPAADVAVQAASAPVTLLVTFTLEPSPLLVGPADVAIQRVACADPCSDAVHFDFVFEDATQPVALPPVPRRAARQALLLPTITCTSFPAVSSAAVNVSLLSADGQRSWSAPLVSLTFTAGGGGVAYISAECPVGLLVGAYTLTVRARDGTSVGKALSLPFDVYDGAAVRVMDAAPASLPTVVHIAGSRLELRAPLAVLLANFPQGLAPDDVVARVGDAAAQVLAVEDVASCPASAQPAGGSALPPTAHFDCNRTRVRILAPPLGSPGVLAVSIAPRASPAAGVAWEVEADSPCNFEALCSAHSLLVDTAALAAAPQLACSEALCVPPAVVSSPRIISAAPLQGLVSGGTLVTLRVEGLPALSTDDVSAYFYASGAKFLAQVLTLEQEPGASLRASAGVLTVVMPSVPAGTGDVSVSLSASVQGLERAARWTFAYLPLLVGPAQATGAAPRELYAGEAYRVTVALGNLQRLPRPWDPTRVRVRVAGGAETGVADVLASDRVSTSISVTVAVPADHAPGNLTVEIWSAAVGAAGAAVLQLTVLPEPSAAVTARFPASGSAAQPHVLDVSLVHLPAAAQLADVTGAVLLSSGAELAATAVKLVAVHDADCVARHCTRFKLTLELPALKSESDRHTGMQARVEVRVGAEAATLAFTYLAAHSPRIVAVDPPARPAVGQSDAPPVEATVLLLQFPSMPCTAARTCAAEAAAAGVVAKIGGRRAEVLELQQMGDLLAVRLAVPASGAAGAAEVMVSTTQLEDNVEALAATAFHFQAPIASVFPLDVPAAGGAFVTVSAAGWGHAARLASADTVHVACNGATGEVRLDVIEVTEAVAEATHARVTLVARANAAPRPGTASCRVFLDSAEGAAATSLFDLAFFAAPAVESLAPSRATFDGRTADGAPAVVHLHVSGIPALASAADVRVSFGDVVCTGAPAPCAVLAFSNRPDGVQLSLSAPHMAAPQTLALFVRFTGAGQRTRSPREATAMFEFYAPLPRVLSIQWCAKCHSGPTCLVAGRCADSVRPLDSRAPSRGAGTLTVVLDNAPALPVSADGPLPLGLAPPSLVLGGVAGAHFLRVAFSDGARAELEFAAPAAPPGEVRVQVAVSAPGTAVPASASHHFTFFDDAVALLCPPAGCAGAAAAPPALVLALTNFPLDPAFPALDQLTISVGEGGAARPALAATLLSSNASLTVLRVAPPPYICATCSFEAGAAAVRLSVARQGDPSRRASTIYTFWRAPAIVEAVFDAAGTMLTITTDQRTDHAGMAAGASDCARILRPDLVAALGDAPRCLWVTDEALSVYLGAGATVMPGDLVALRPGVLRSANRLSRPSNASAVIAAPPVLQALLVSLSGPATVDPCSDLTVAAHAPSPRPLSFAWRALNDDGLAAALAGLTGPTLYLPSGTPDLATPGKSYLIGVRATSFLGVQSDEVVIAVTKLQRPAPRLTFTPSVLSVTRAESVRMRANALFSECGAVRETLLFQWSQVLARIPPPAQQCASAPALSPRRVTQVSGPSAIPASLLSASVAALSFPAADLVAGGTYELAARVSLAGLAPRLPCSRAAHRLCPCEPDAPRAFPGAAGDPASASEARVKLHVAMQPLQARLAGGSALRATTAAPLRLDASASRDPDDDAPGAPLLAFAWSCSLASAVGSAGPCKDRDGRKLALPATALLTIPALELSPSQEAPYLFTVTVSKAGKAPATASLPVTLVAEPVPRVELAAHSGILQPSGRRLVNPGAALALSAVCDAPAATRSLAWSVAPAVDLAAAGGGGGEQLYLPEGAGLLAAGSTYAVTATCRAGGAAGAASLELEVNAPPVGLPCAACRLGTGVCAKTGPAVFSTFRLACERWADPHGGLEYQFGYEGSYDGELRAVQFEWGPAAHVDLVLPAGALLLKARVRDRWGAETPWMSDLVTVTSSAAPGRRVLPPPASAARALLQEELGSVFDWDGALALLVDARRGGNAGVVNQIASALLLHAEADFPAAGAGAQAKALSAAELRVAILAEVAASANALHSGGALSGGYVCETLAVLAVGAQPAGPKLARSDAAMVSNLTAALLEARGSPALAGTGVNAECAGHAADALAAALGAATGVAEDCAKGGGAPPPSAGSGPAEVDALERGLRGLALRAGALMVAGQPTVELASAGAHRYAVRKGALETLAGAAGSLAMPAGDTVGYQLPVSLASALSQAGSGAASTMELLFGAAPGAPLLQGLQAASPLVTLDLSHGGVRIPVSGLSDAVRISLPFNFSRLCPLPSTSTAVRLRPQCRYFDAAAGEYLAEGCATLAGDAAGRVTCSCTHLTTFVVVPEEVESTTTGAEHALSTSPPETEGVTDTAATTTPPVRSESTTAASHGGEEDGGGQQTSEQESAAGDGVTTPAPTPVEPGSEHFVALALGLPLSKQDFTEARQLVLRQSVASASGTAVDAVVITSITQVELRRRATSPMLEVGLAIETASAEAARTLASKPELAEGALAQRLSTAGLPGATLVQAPAAVSTSQAPTSAGSTSGDPGLQEGALEPAEGSDGGGIAGVIGGAVAASLIAAAVTAVCLIRLKRNQGKHSSAEASQGAASPHDSIVTTLQCPPAVVVRAHDFHEAPSLLTHPVPPSPRNSGCIPRLTPMETPTTTNSLSSSVLTLAPPGAARESPWERRLHSAGTSDGSADEIWPLRHHKSAGEHGPGHLAPAPRAAPRLESPLTPQGSEQLPLGPWALAAGGAAREAEDDEQPVVRRNSAGVTSLPRGLDQVLRTVPPRIDSPEPPPGLAAQQRERLGGQGAAPGEWTHGHVQHFPGYRS